MKSRQQIHEELRQWILALDGVTERQNAGIHEDAFLVDGTMFMHIHGRGYCDIRLPRDIQKRVLEEGKAVPHRWAPEAGYVTCVVTSEKELDTAKGVINMSHDHFSHRNKNITA